MAVRPATHHTTALLHTTPPPLCFSRCVWSLRMSCTPCITLPSHGCPKADDAKLCMHVCVSVLSVRVNMYDCVVAQFVCTCA